MTRELTAREILDALVAFPTVSMASNLDLVAWVRNYLEGHAIPTQTIPSPCGEKAHLYAWVGPDVPDGIMLSGHSDVVPVDGQDWTSDPWAVTERDGKLFGRGTCDMKGFDALAIAALVKARRQPLKRPLQFALSYDEERGAMAVVSLIDAMAAHLPKAKAVIVGEPTLMKVTTGHKGAVAFKVKITGHEVHSSLLHRGVSAVMEGARIVHWANEVNAANAATVPPELAAAFDPPYTMLHVGKFNGGTAGNIAAGSAEFVMDARMVPGDDDWASKILDKIASVERGMKAVRPQTSIAVTLTVDLPALAPEPEGYAEALSRRITGDNGLHMVSYGTEASQFQRRGFSCVVCGPGSIEQAHQPDEWLALSEFEAGARYLDRLIDELC